MEFLLRTLRKRVWPDNRRMHELVESGVYLNLKAFTINPDGATDGQMGEEKWQIVHKLRGGWTGRTVHFPGNLDGFDG